MPSTITGSSTWDFITLRGRPQYPGQELEDVTRPGKNGVAYRRLGKRSNPFVLEGVRDFLTDTTANTFVKGLEEARGSIVTIEDDHGRLFGEAVLLDVTELARQEITGSVGGKVADSTILCTIGITARLIGTTY